MNNERFEQILRSSRRAVRTLAAARTASQVTLADSVRNNALTDAKVTELSSLFDPWQPNVAVAVGALREWNSTVAECLQAHTTQTGWEPPAVPALWQVRGTASSQGEPIRWVQPNTLRPDGFLQYAYAENELVIYDRPQDGGADWVFSSNLAANTTEPSRDGELDRWWTPLSLASEW